MSGRAEVLEAAAKGLIDGETNGLCGDSWPGPCDMCDCGLEGMAQLDAACGESAARDRDRAAAVLRRVLPVVADAILQQQASNQFRNAVIQRCANLVRDLVEQP